MPLGLATAVTRVQRAAYAVEADLIGDDRIPALRESVAEVASAPLSWWLAIAGEDADVLVGSGAPGRVVTAPADGLNADRGPRGALLGAAGVTEAVDADHGTVLAVDRLVVDPRHHRRGVGMALLAAVLAEAADRDAGVAVSTARTNAPALRLYSALGFRPVRDAEVVPGMWVRHLSWRQRPAVRVVCLDDQHRILLLGWRDPHDGHLLWEPPGGGIELDEQPFDAACRELAEETGLTASIDPTPVPVARDQWWDGRRHIAVEQFFLARVPGHRPGIDQRALLADEVRNASGHQWASLDELHHLDGHLEPPDLAALVQDALVSSPPPAP